MTTTVEFRTPEETALQLEVLLLGTLTSRNFPAGPIPALPISDVKLSREIRKLSDRIHELSTHGEDGIGVIGAVTAARRALASTWIAATIAGKRPVTLVDADLRSAHLSFDQGLELGVCLGILIDDVRLHRLANCHTFGLLPQGNDVAHGPVEQLLLVLEAWHRLRSRLALAIGSLARKLAVQLGERPEGGLVLQRFHRRASGAACHRVADALLVR